MRMMMGLKSACTFYTHALSMPMDMKYDRLKCVGTKLTLFKMQFFFV